jgi:hypothetical protein
MRGVVMLTLQGCFVSIKERNSAAQLETVFGRPSMGPRGADWELSTKPIHLKKTGKTTKKRLHLRLNPC